MTVIAVTDDVGAAWEVVIIDRQIGVQSATKPWRSCEFGEPRQPHFGGGWFVPLTDDAGHEFLLGSVEMDAIATALRDGT